MKIKHPVTAILIALIINVSTTAFAAMPDETVAVTTETRSFTKVEIRGNVVVYLTDGNTNSVTAFNNAYGEKVLIQNQNNTLRISSYTKQALVVYVTVADLRELSVYDDAVVRSGKSLSAIELEINLYHHAAAQLNLQAYNAVININDRAQADLSGNITNCDMHTKKASMVNMANLTADHLNRNIRSNSLRIVKANSWLADNNSKVSFL